MGFKYPILSPEQVIVALGKLGFAYKSQRGSHKKLVRNGLTVIIPMHNELAKGTLKSILEQAGIDLETLQKHL